jgi:hypothetical protein
MMTHLLIKKSNQQEREREDERKCFNENVAFLNLELKVVTEERARDHRELLSILIIYYF